MEIDHEFMKDRSPLGSVDHVVNLQFGKRAIFAKQRSGHPLPIHSPTVGDVAQMRFDPGFAPDVFGFYDGHSRLFSSLRGGASGMSRFIFVIFSHAFCWAAVMIGTNSSGESTRSVRKRRIWMDRSLFCSAAESACRLMLAVRLL